MIPNMCSLISWRSWYSARSVVHRCLFWSSAVPYSLPSILGRVTFPLEFANKELQLHKIQLIHKCVNQTNRIVLIHHRFQRTHAHLMTVLRWDKIHEVKFSRIASQCICVLIYLSSNNEQDGRLIHELPFSQGKDCIAHQGDRQPAFSIRFLDFQLGSAIKHLNIPLLELDFGAG